MMNLRGHAVSVFILIIPQSIRTPHGVMADDILVPLVKDPRKEFPFWKFPGGKNEEDEEPEDTALREIKEETGICLNPAQMSLIYEKDKGTHSKFVFLSALTELPPIKKVGDEGEDVALFKLSEMWEMVDLLESHYEIIEPALGQLLFADILTGS